MMFYLKRDSKLLQFIIVLSSFFLLYFTIDRSETNMFWRLPSLISWLPLLINDVAEFLLNEWMPIEFFDADVEEYRTRPLVLQITRVISRSMLFCIEFIREILLGGVETIVAFTSWDFVTENEWAKWPALPWTVVAGGAIILGYKLQGRRLALLVAFSVIYISVFGGFLSEEQMKSRSMYAGITTNTKLTKGVRLDVSKIEQPAMMSFSSIKIDKNHFETNELEVFKGPEFDKLSSNQQKELFNTEYTISKESNRMAYQCNELFKNSLNPIITSFLANFFAKS